MKIENYIPAVPISSNSYPRFKIYDNIRRPLEVKRFDNWFFDSPLFRIQGEGDVKFQIFLDIQRIVEGE